MKKIFVLLFLLAPIFNTVSYAISLPVHQQIAHKKLLLNKATYKELRKINGMNAHKAHSIISYRKKHGSFKSFADLRKVKGFKRIKAEKLKAMTDQMQV